MNLTAFYNAIRPHVNLTTENVHGFDFLLGKMAAGGTKLNVAANRLGTVYWETAQRMQPIDEYGSDAYFNGRYGPQTRVGKVLGNKYVGDGARYHGRGYVQLTGRSNYAKAGNVLGMDLLNNPDKAKDREIAWRILDWGMRTGAFTGKDEADYIDDIDESDADDYREYVNARRVINGTDKAETIAKLSLNFERALKAAGYGQSVSRPQPIPQRPGTTPDGPEWGMGGPPPLPDDPGPKPAKPQPEPPQSGSFDSGDKPMPAKKKRGSFMGFVAFVALAAVALWFFLKQVAGIDLVQVIGGMF